MADAISWGPPNSAEGRYPKKSALLPESKLAQELVKSDKVAQARRVYAD